MQKLKSGVYFVLPSRCESFIEHARTSGWSPDVEQLRQRYENKTDEYYIVFSLDADEHRVGTWGGTNIQWKTMRPGMIGISLKNISKYINITNLTFCTNNLTAHIPVPYSRLRLELYHFCKINESEN